MTVSAPSIRLDRAGVAFDGRALFADLDLDIEAGRWTCLLGPSGVGKSTLLRLVAGLVPGSRAGGVAAGDGGPVAARVAFMAQQDLLLPWLDARDNVLLGARLRGQPRTMAGPRRSWRSWGSPPPPGSAPPPCRAACASGSRWPAP